MKFMHLPYKIKQSSDFVSKVANVKFFFPLIVQSKAKIHNENSDIESK